MFESLLSIERGVDVNAFDLSREFLLQRLQREQVVAEDQPIVEDIVVRDPMLGVIRLIQIFEQDAWLQLGPFLLADPGQFEFLFDTHFCCFIDLVDAGDHQDRTSPRS